MAVRRLDGADVKSLVSSVGRRFGYANHPVVASEANVLLARTVPVQGDQHFGGCDGLITNQPGLALGIHVADCCAVYLVDPVTPAVGLVHSGKKGTELDIIGTALDQMAARFGSETSDMIVQLSACIRPPHYEIDFAALIIEQSRDRGVRQIHDGGLCTGCDLEAFYSYRMEKGRTGRMLALLGLKERIGKEV